MREVLAKALPEEFKKLAVEYTGQLVRQDSSNPPGDEYDAAQFAAGELERCGFEVLFDEFEPRRCNVAARLGNCERAGLLFLGHLDVVPAVGNWAHGKFCPEVEGDRLYGRGASDMKGGIAAMMAAAAAFARSGMKLEKGVVLLLDSDEENGNKGIHRILGAGPLRAEAAIVGEPSDVGLLLGNKGYSSFFVKTTGVSCHASQPERGENAIYKMAEALRLLQEYAARLQKRTAPHLGRATLSVGTIRGGTRINVVPEECLCEVERRVLPGETYESVRGELVELLDGVAEVLPRAHFTPPSLLDEGHPFAVETARVIKAVLGRKPEIGVFTGGTEAAFVAQFGIPTLILGPGSLEQAHGTDEYVSVGQVGQCADIYYRLIQRLCGAPQPAGPNQKKKAPGGQAQ